MSISKFDGISTVVALYHHLLIYGLYCAMSVIQVHFCISNTFLKFQYDCPNIFADVI